ncbi:MAG: 5-(carboxyamino)imidazole ribonucleotide mutase [Akkermansiaceae bacterium]
MSVGIIMGSTSDWPTMEHAARVLKDFGVPFEAEVVSAHRTPDRLVEYAKGAKAKGLKCIIAGAGGAAHLPGMVAAMTELPVLGVPVESKVLKGVDSLLSIVQMPAGIPTATFAIGKAGSTNAGLFAVSMLAVENEELAVKLSDFRKNQSAKVADAVLPELD